MGRGQRRRGGGREVAAGGMASAGKEKGGVIDVVGVGTASG